MKVIMDVFPMATSRFSGIPQMTWHLVKRLRDKPGFVFTLGHRVLDDETVEALIQDRSGRGLLRLPHGSSSRFLGARDVHSSLYFSPHTMSLQTRRSRGSVRIVHDVSSITHPGFHHPDTISIDRRQLAVQVAICCRVITVSESSKLEIVRYLGLPEWKVVVARPGVSWDANHTKVLAQRPVPYPYALVLGTREPRKNLALIHRYLERYAHEVRRSGRRVVIAGSQGWGADEMQSASVLVQDLMHDGWLRLLDHVHEEEKLSLVAHADFLVAASVTEGFGSPPAEALSLGVPVVSSWGGSLPGTVGSSGYFFDPYNVDSLAAAIERVHADLLVDPVAVRSQAWMQGMEFSWEECARVVFATLEEVWDEAPIAHLD